MVSLPKCLKVLSAQSIYPSLTHLFNISIRNGRIPQEWKLSFVVPIPKSTDKKENPTNYRPISLLSIISKLLKKHIFNMVSQHLIQNNLLSDDQWGFSPGKSTVTALILSFHNILKSLELGSDVGLVFFDLRKAFDSVPHLPLVQRLRNIGLNCHIVQWITNYLKKFEKISKRNLLNVGMGGWMDGCTG